MEDDMCVTSMIMDHYREQIPQWPVPTQPWELEEIRRRLSNLEELLRKAKIYDEENDQPDCELDGKKQEIRDLAERLGVEIAFP